MPINFPRKWNHSPSPKRKGVNIQIFTVLTYQLSLIQILGLNKAYHCFHTYIDKEKYS